MKHMAWMGMIFVSMLLPGCGQEASSPAAEETLVGFEGSACKKYGDETALRVFRLHTMDDSSSLEGLSCVSWKKVNARTLQVDLTNFPGACGVDFQGSANLNDDGTLQLLLRNPGCDVASCGWCTYDWSFEATVDPLPDQLPLSIVVDTYPESICSDLHDDAKMDRYSLTLPLVDGDTGLVCRLQHYWSMEDYAMSLGLDGRLRMPCRNYQMSKDTLCEGDLVCTPTGDTDSPKEICAEPCSGDTDCSSPDLFECGPSICTLRTTW